MVGGDFKRPARLPSRITGLAYREKHRSKDHKGRWPERWGPGTPPQVSAAGFLDACLDRFDLRRGNAPNLQTYLLQSTERRIMLCIA